MHARFVALVVALVVTGCHNGDYPQQVTPAKIPPFHFEATGEEFLNAAVDELEAIAAMSGGSGMFKPGHRVLLSKLEADSVYIYGEINPDGTGAVVTERHAYPKGILLITVRKSYGNADGSEAVETRRYTSPESFAANLPEQTTVTRVVGLSADTILTHVVQNGILETYTFRLPVVNRVINTQDGTVRVITRYGLNGQVISEIRDGDGTFIRLNRNSGLRDGSIVTRTEYADGSWRSVRTVGQADGSILRETTSGL